MRFAAGGDPDVSCRAGVDGALVAQPIRKLTTHRHNESQKKRFMSAPRVTDTLNFANLWAQVSLSTSTDHAHEYITPDRLLFAEASPLSTRCSEQSRTRSLSLNHGPPRSKASDRTRSGPWGNTLEL